MGWCFAADAATAACRMGGNPPARWDQAADPVSAGRSATVHCSTGHHASPFSAGTTPPARWRAVLPDYCCMEAARRADSPHGRSAPLAGFAQGGCKGGNSSLAVYCSRTKRRRSEQELTMVAVRAWGGGSPNPSRPRGRGRGPVRQGAAVGRRSTHRCCKAPWLAYTPALPGMRLRGKSSTLRKGFRIAGGGLGSQIPPFSPPAVSHSMLQHMLWCEVEHYQCGTVASGPSAGTLLGFGSGLHTAMIHPAMHAQRPHWATVGKQRRRARLPGQSTGCNVRCRLPWLGVKQAQACAPPAPSCPLFRLSALASLAGQATPRVAAWRLKAMEAMGPARVPRWRLDSWGWKSWELAR